MATGNPLDDQLMALLDPAEEERRRQQPEEVNPLDAEILSLLEKPQHPDATPYEVQTGAVPDPEYMQYVQDARARQGLEKEELTGLAGGQIAPGIAGAISGMGGLQASAARSPAPPEAEPAQNYFYDISQDIGEWLGILKPMSKEDRQKAKGVLSGIRQGGQGTIGVEGIPQAPLNFAWLMSGGPQLMSTMTKGDPSEPWRGFFESYGQAVLPEGAEPYHSRYAKLAKEAGIESDDLATAIGHAIEWTTEPTAAVTAGIGKLQKLNRLRKVADAILEGSKLPEDLAELQRQLKWAAEEFNPMVTKRIQEARKYRRPEAPAGSVSADDLLPGIPLEPYRGQLRKDTEGIRGLVRERRSEILKHERERQAAEQVLGKREAAIAEEMRRSRGDKFFEGQRGELEGIRGRIRESRIRSGDPNLKASRKQREAALFGRDEYGTTQQRIREERAFSLAEQKPEPASPTPMTMEPPKPKGGLVTTEEKGLPLPETKGVSGAAMREEEGPVFRIGRGGRNIRTVSTDKGDIAHRESLYFISGHGEPMDRYFSSLADLVKYYRKQYPNAKFVPWKKEIQDRVNPKFYDELAGEFARERKANPEMFPEEGMPGVAMRSTGEAPPAMQPPKPRGKAIPGTAEYRPTVPPKPAKTVKPTREEGEIKSIRQLTKDLADLTDALISTKGGKNVRTGVSGYYRLFQQDITVRNPNDFGTISHEVAHRIEDVIFKGSGDRGKMMGTTFSSYASELNPIASPATSASSQLSEGFAEFMRMYMTNPAEAERVAPRFYNDFLSLIATHDKKLAKGLARLQKEVRKYRGKTNTEKMIANFAEHDESIYALMSDPVGRTTNELVDDLVYVKDLVNKVLKSGGKVREELNPGRLSEELRHLTGRYEGVLTEGVKSFHNPTKVVSPALTAAYRKSGDPKRLAAYQVASRMLAASQKADDPAVISNVYDLSRDLSQDELRDILREIIRDTPQKIKDAAKDVKKFDDAHIDYLSDAGLFSGEAAKKMQNANNAMYAPMSRLVEGTPGYHGAGAGFLKKFKGQSEKAVLDPSVQRVLNVYAGMRRAKENEINLALLDIATQNPGLATQWGIRDLPGQFGLAKRRHVLEDLSATTGESVEKLAARYGLTPDEVDEFVSFGHSSYKGEKGKTVRRVLNYKGVSGKRPLPNIDKDEILLEVPDHIHEALSNTPGGWENSFLMNFLGVPADLFRVGVTQNIAFGTYNFSKDALSSMATSRTQKIPILDMLYNSFLGVKGTWNKDAFYKAARDSGALLGYREAVASRELKKVQKAVISKKDKGVFRKMLDLTFAEGAKLSEDSTRVGEVSRMILQKGWDPTKLTRAQMAQLGDAGRNVGPNFVLHGAKMKALNRISPFFGASVQGYNMIYQAAKRNPVKFASMVSSGVVAPSVYMWYANHNKDWYKRLTESDRRRFWHFEVGGNIYKLPKPHDIGHFGTLAERILDHLYKERPNSIDEMMLIGMGIGDGLLPLSNPVLKILAEGISGKKFDAPLEGLYMGEEAADIVPQQLRKGESWTQEYPDQGVITRGLGRAAGISPIMLQRQLRNLVGTTGMEGIKAAEMTGVPDAIAKRMGMETVQPPAKTGRDIPIIGRFLEPDAQVVTAHSQEFYRLLREAKTAEETIKRIPNQDKLRDYMKDKQDVLRKMPKLKKYLKVINQWKKKRDSVRASDIGRDEKRKQIDEINKRMADLYEKAVSG